MNITGQMAELVFQLGLIIFAVRLGGRAVKKIGIPPVLGELLAGVLIGPYALGGIGFPGFPQGLFPPGGGEGGAAGLAVSPELYAFATVASIILLFSSGLETDLGLFLRYSVAGGIIGIGGVICSFAAGVLSGVFLLHIPFMDPQCLFLGVLSTATSVGITARILSDQKKMDSPEGVTILAAAVFDDVLGIIALAVILGLVSLVSGSSDGAAQGFRASAILGIAGKAFGFWLGFTALGLIFSKQLARFLKIFRHSFDFSILALGIALLLAGLFEKQGLAMIIGAYIVGLSLSKTDIAAVVQDRIRGLYEFFVPIFFAVMGMMVNVREIFSGPVLIFGAVYTLAAVLSKIIGCGGPALLLGFNLRGSLRIGTGMVPRGEVALIIAGIGLSSGVLDDQLFAVIILMTLITTLMAPPLLNTALKLPGQGARRPVKDEDSAQEAWEFESAEIAALVADTLRKGLRDEGFYVQIMNIDEGLSQARKDDIALSITEAERAVTIETSKTDIGFAKTAVYEVILGLSGVMEKLRASSNPGEMKKDLAGMEGRTPEDLLSLVREETISLELKGETKEALIAEMVDLLAARGKLENRDLVLEDVLQREKTMSTGMQHGIALPHAKSDGVNDICVAVGLKKAGIDFESSDGEKSRLFIMVVSPKKISGPHIRFLAAIGAVLRDDTVCQAVFKARSKGEVLRLLTKK